MDFRRVLIKISGESMSGSGAFGAFDLGVIQKICQNIKNVVDMGIDVSLVVGGGNIIRGKSLDNDLIDRLTSDSMGMMSTVINGLVIRRILQNIGVESIIFSSLDLPFGIQKSSDISSFDIRNRVVIFVGGTGYPYFSTDTAASINSLLCRANIILKATKTDGIYDKDPAIFNDAIHIPNLTYSDALNQNLKIMDSTAFSIAMENRIKIIVFSIFEDDCFRRALKSDIKCSIVS